jgi:hypothetical protein
MMTEEKHDEFVKKPSSLKSKGKRRCATSTKRNYQVKVEKLA